MSPPPKGPPRGATAAALLIVPLWATCFALGRALGNPTVVLALLSGAALVVGGRYWGPPPHRSKVKRLRYDVAVGLVVGAVSVGATHLLWPTLGSLLPVWREEHRALISLVGNTPILVPLVAFVAAAEELLFRGALLSVLQARVEQRRTAFVLAAMLYAGAQVGSGSSLVVVAALGLGSLWLWLRVVTSSLVPPVVAHLCWTLSTLFFWPVPSGA